jgi:hypothetical protein
MPATDAFSRQRALTNDPYTNAVAVTPHDTNDLTYVTRGVYVGGAGTVKVNMQDSGTVTFTGVPVGTLLPIRATRVYSTGTTATTILALW